MMFFFKGRSVIVAPVDRAKPDGIVAYIPRAGRRIEDAASALPSDRQADDDKPLL